MPDEVALVTGAASGIAAAVAHLSSAEASYTNGAPQRLDGGSTAGYYASN